MSTIQITDLYAFDNFNTPDSQRIKEARKRMFTAADARELFEENGIVYPFPGNDAALAVYYDFKVILLDLDYRRAAGIDSFTTTFKTISIDVYAPNAKSGNVKLLHDILMHEKSLAPLFR